MAGISGSNKVSRAARTGGSGRRRGESSLGFYALLIVIALVGSGVVAFSRDERLDATTPNNTAPLEPVSDSKDQSKNREGDRWYEAYGLYICDKYVPPINNTADPYGISTKNDGILYIHPYQKDYAGKNATLGVFADAVGLELKDKSIKVPGDETEYKSGETKCGEEIGELVIKEWSDPTKADDFVILRSSPRDIRVKNNAAVVVGFVPKGKEDEIPLPESATNGNLTGASAKESSEAAAAAGAPGAPAAGAPEAPAGGTTPTTVAGG